MLEVIMAESDVDALLAFRAYQQMHGEGFVPGPLDPVKALTNVFRWVQGPGSVVILVMDGDLVAGVLTLCEGTFWYNEEKWLGDKGLYVLPDYRGDGETLKLLLGAAKTVSDDAKLPCFITINNGRRKRGGRSDWERTGATLGYLNRGAVLTHTPET